MLFSIPSMQLTALACLAAAVLGAPTKDDSSKDVFSPSNWPYPAKIFGDTDGWGTVHIHDPSVVKHDGWYYSFGTHLRVTIARSPTLYGPWKHLGSVLDAGQSIIELPGRDDIWAPDVIKVGDTFHCYYSVSTFGAQNSAIGLATSKTLLPGSWTDHGEVVRSYDLDDYPNATEPWTITNAIDPAVLFDAKTGKPYMSYGSFWTNIWGFPLNKAMDGIEEGVAPKHLSYDPVSPNPVEGPFIHYASKTGYYYLFVSHGYCCGYNASMPAAGEEYKIKVGRSKAIDGPFLDRNGTDMVNGGGDVILGSHGWLYGPGGQGVLVDGKKDILYYHYVDNRVSYIDEDKYLGWNEIKYSKGWPYLV
ncbi:putative arabinan endo-1,5-alpha-L-arabinosidase A [Morchella snyderi]|nr:putative arabinan endo-1,5-alpha-L-arabinosidase A [Morchella snyderi]